MKKAGRIIACILGFSLYPSLIAQAASPQPVGCQRHGGNSPASGQRGRHCRVEKGGTAVDAAVAVGYALAVVDPAAGNLGGGGFMNIRLANGTETFIDFREKAPLAARADMYLDAKGNVAPNLSTRGYKAVGVPCSVAGLEYVREKYATRSRAELIGPSIALADNGFTRYATSKFFRKVPRILPRTRLRQQSF